MQNRFLSRCHNNRADSSDDTPENSSPRNISVIGSLLNGSGMYIKTQNITLVCSHYRSLGEKTMYKT